MSLLLLTLIFRRILVGRVLAGGDLQLYFFPYWTAVVRSIYERSLPLWNSYLFAGSPLFANTQIGVFYPLNWPFWLLSGPSLGSVTRAIHLNIFLHVCLAAFSTYALVRRPNISGWAAAMAGLVYAGSGFIGAHTEHLNQLQGLAWLPLLFLPGTTFRPRFGSRLTDRLVLPRPVSIGALSMILLAGHTQMAFIAAVGLLAWYVTLAVLSNHGHQEPAPGACPVARRFFSLPATLIPFALAAVIAAVQLLPGIELAGLSGRGDGLDWREAVSFSLVPWELHRSLLPSYIVPPQLPEGVAYLGIAATLLLAFGAWEVLHTRSGEGRAWLAVSGLGLFLALGGYNPLYLLAVRLGLPGFIHFRAPARFLALYVLGASVLVAIGFEWLRRRALLILRGSGRAVEVLLPALLLAGIGAELYVSAEYLPHARATTPRAYTDLRPATADLVSASRTSVIAGEVPGRFLSISQTLFEVGDKAEIETAYGDSLSEDALWSYLVASKYREVLAPNLSLAFQVPAADGYDGGLLPTRHYTTFTQLLLPNGTADGRLRENLSSIPDGRWLDLMGVRYLLTDKTTDVWIGDILYDRQFQPVLEADAVLDVAWLPEDFASDALWLLYEGQEGEVSIALADGRVLAYDLPPSDSLDAGHEVRWAGPDVVRSVQFRSADGSFRLGGGSLVDSRLDAFYAIVLSDAYRLVHSGDVKIYEDLTPPSRAFLVHRACQVESEDAALERMRDAAFDPKQLVILEGDGGCPVEMNRGPAILSESEGESVTVARHGATEIVVDVQADSAAHLVLADSWYPGWTATLQRVDEPAAEVSEEVLRADVLFRAVPIPKGSWRVTFSYHSRYLGTGAVISLIGIVLCRLYACRLAGSRQVRDPVLQVAKR